MAKEQKDASGETKNDKNKTWIAVVFGVIEAISLVLWQTADDFNGSSAYWIHFFSKCGFLAGGAYLAHEFTKGIIWRVCIWLALLLFCAVLFITKPPKSIPHAFYVKTFFANIGIGYKAQNFLLWEYKTKAFTPINIQMLIQIVNLKSDPLKIYSCQFEGKNTNGNWEVFPMIDRRYGDLVFRNGGHWGIQNPNENPDPSKTYFPELLDGKTLASEPITGYVLLEVPEDALADSLRLRLFAAGDLEIAENVNLQAETNHLQTELHDSWPITTYRQTTNDMSQIPISPYSFIHKIYGQPNF